MYLTIYVAAIVLLIQVSTFEVRLIFGNEWLPKITEPAAPEGRPTEPKRDQTVPTSKPTTAITTRPVPNLKPTPAPVPKPMLGDFLPCNRYNYGSEKRCEEFCKQTTVNDDYECLGVDDGYCYCRGRQKSAPAPELRPASDDFFQCNSSDYRSKSLCRDFCESNFINGDYYYFCIGGDCLCPRTIRGLGDFIPCNDSHTRRKCMEFCTETTGVAAYLCFGNKSRCLCPVAIPKTIPALGDHLPCDISDHNSLKACEEFCINTTGNAVYICTKEDEGYCRCLEKKEPTRRPITVPDDFLRCNSSDYRSEKECEKFCMEAHGSEIYFCIEGLCFCPERTAAAYTKSCNEYNYDTKKSCKQHCIKYTGVTDYFCDYGDCHCPVLKPRTSEIDAIVSCKVWQVMYTHYSYNCSDLGIGYICINNWAPYCYNTREISTALASVPKPTSAPGDLLPCNTSDHRSLKMCEDFCVKTTGVWGYFCVEEDCLCPVLVPKPTQAPGEFVSCNILDRDSRKLCKEFCIETTRIAEYLCREGDCLCAASVPTTTPTPGDRLPCNITDRNSLKKCKQYCMEINVDAIYLCIGEGYCHCWENKKPALVSIPTPAPNDYLPCNISDRHSVAKCSSFCQYTTRDGTYNCIGGDCLCYVQLPKLPSVPSELMLCPDQKDETCKEFCINSTGIAKYSSKFLVFKWDTFMWMCQCAVPIPTTIPALGDRLPCESENDMQKHCQEYCIEVTGYTAYLCMGGDVGHCQCLGKLNPRPTLALLPIPTRTPLPASKTTPIPASNLKPTPTRSTSPIRTPVPPASMTPVQTPTLAQPHIHLQYNFNPQLIINVYAHGHGLSGMRPPVPYPAPPIQVPPVAPSPTPEPPPWEAEILLHPPLYSPDSNLQK